MKAAKSGLVIIIMFFFDIDNTLIDYDTSEAKAIVALYVEMGNILLSEMQIAYWHMISQRYFSDYLSNQLSFEEQGMLRIKDMSMNCGLDVDEYNSKKWFEKYQIILSNSWLLFDDVIETLDLLKGKRLGIISNGNAKQQRQKLICTNIDSYFEIQIFSSEVGEAKPSYKIFEEALLISKEEKENVVYIGDNVRTDIIPCERLGIKSILIDREGQSDSVENRVLKLQEVLYYFEKRNL